jgi:pyruvate/2-oxoglutarate dehydrogenase complex dihydrolipoamide dehydrogenase (E3) component
MDKLRGNGGENGGLHVAKRRSGTYGHRGRGLGYISKVMKAMKEYDVVIIGAGQTGIPLARKLATAAQRVAIVERKHLGGSCVNFGCTPTKAVVASARVAHLARRAAEFGILLPDPKIDFPKVLARARKFVEESKASLAKGLAECRAHVIDGQARFAERDSKAFVLSVGEQSVRATQVVINTGARTLLPEIEGLESLPYIHAGNWLDAKALPDHVLFAGVGYIALEMAQFYRRMGSRVTVIGSSKQIAEHEDADVSQALQSVLEAEGISFRLDTQVKTARRDGDGVCVGIESNGKRELISGSHLFIATGRRPNTDDLGLETVGLKTDEHGVIPVDERLATSVPNVWAAGDVRGGPMFTNSSWDDHRILESQLLGDGTRTAAGRIVPYAIFTDPELGRVGMSETQARKQHGDHVKVAKFERKHTGTAAELGETVGFIKLIADRRDGKLLGAAVLASEGAELAGSYITLMNAKATLDAICGGIYIHPTLTEAVQSAASSLKLHIDSTLTAK